MRSVSPPEADDFGRAAGQEAELGTVVVVEGAGAGGEPPADGNAGSGVAVDWSTGEDWPAPTALDETDDIATAVLVGE